MPGTFLTAKLSYHLNYHPADVTLREGRLDERKWLIAREIPKLRRYALALVNDPVAADDLVQDTLERAIRKRHLWSRRGSMRGWLYRVLYNVFINQTGKRRRAQAEVDLDQAPALMEARSQEQTLICCDIVEAMRRLPPDQRAAIALTAIEGLSYDEAADVLSIPIGTLRSRISRGRDELRSLYPGVRSEPHLRRVK